MLAKAIARVIQPLAKRSGGELPFATLNCSVDKSSANIFGGDIHTVGKGGGKLTRICGKFHANPAVIVIDEIDKCSPDALKGFYRVFDDGSEWLPLRAWCSSGMGEQLDGDESSNEQVIFLIVARRSASSLSHSSLSSARRCSCGTSRSCDAWASSRGRESTLKRSRQSSASDGGLRSARSVMVICSWSPGHRIPRVGRTEYRLGEVVFTLKVSVRRAERLVMNMSWTTSLLSVSWNCSACGWTHTLDIAAAARAAADRGAGESC